MPSKKASSATRPAPPEKSILTPDSRLTFPEFFLLSASAGSGKTHALSLRFVQFLLSDKIGRISRNDLPNILAVTFTKNAAREMKERILDWLKRCHSGKDEEDKKKLEEIQAVVSGSPEQLMAAAGDCVDRILARYSDFQVETIDSFTAAVFKASAVDLGVSPDYEIVLEPSELIAYAFSRYLRKVNAESAEGRDFEKVLDLLLKNQAGDSAFDWDPAPRVREKIDALYRKLSAQSKPLTVEDLDRERGRLEKEIVEAGADLETRIEESGLEKTTRGHCFKKILPAIKNGDFADLLAASFKTEPVKRPKSDSKAQAACDGVLARWGKLEALVRDHRRLYARGFYTPYLLAYRSFMTTLDQVKRQQGVVFIDDINKRLSGYLDQGIVPDIYFRLGERVFHFLIDEFQDTSPMQWKNLVPLIENSLAQAGSLFVVGDTKQAIYGFRDADYRIMKRLVIEAEAQKEGRKLSESEAGANPFESVHVDFHELTTNYRCRREILDFVKSKFLRKRDEGSDEKKGPGKLPEKYFDQLEESLLNSFTQEVGPRQTEPGHVEYIILNKSAEPTADPGEKSFEDSAESERPGDPDAGGGDGGAPGTGDASDGPEKLEIQERVRDLHARGFAYADIAVLAFTNNSVADVSSWLNDIDVPFIPHSSLDIRRRKVIAETLKLLQFLDSPPDDLSFAAFLLSDLFREKVERDGFGDRREEWRSFLFDCRLKKESPLYAAFRKRCPQLWDRYLERFFKIVGYYPLYDLVTLIFRMFDVFELFPKEEASLTRLLEAIKDFEGKGRNDLREFLAMSGDEGGDASGWTIDVPPDIDAVRVMSIHKAKGLGFPAVILLLYDKRIPYPEFHFEQDEDSVRVLKLTKAMAMDDAELRPIYEETQMRDDVGRINALYVAMTRAAAELHIIGVKGKRMSYPFDFLGVEPYVSKDASGRPIAPQHRPRAPRKKAEPEKPRAEKLRFRELFELPIETRETLNRNNIRRGEIAHALLAEVEYLSADGESELAEAASRLTPDEGEAAVMEDVKRHLVLFFQASGLLPYFEARPGRQVFTELEVCDKTGRERRLDRVVVDPGEVFVLEFKTGIPSEPGRRREWEEEDRRIFKAYLEIMKDIHPDKNVRGAFAFIDRGTVEAVP